MGSYDIFSLVLAFIVLAVAAGIAVFLHDLATDLYMRIYGVTNRINKTSNIFFSTIYERLFSKPKRILTTHPKTNKFFTQKWGNIFTIALVAIMIVTIVASMLSNIKKSSNYFEEYIIFELFFGTPPMYPVSLLVKHAMGEPIAIFSNIFQYAIMSLLSYSFFRFCSYRNNMAITIIYNFIFMLFSSVIFSYIPDSVYKIPGQVYKAILYIPQSEIYEKLIDIKIIGAISTLIVLWITITLLRIWTIIVINLLAVAVREISFTILFSIPSIIAVLVLFYLATTIAEMIGVSDVNTITGIVTFFATFAFTFYLEITRMEAEEEVDDI